jgi:hypothetical protein
MKQSNPTLPKLFLAAVLFSTSGLVLSVSGEDTPPPALASLPADQVAQIRKVWLDGLEDAKHDALSRKDHETAELVGRILAAVNQSDGTDPSVIAVHGKLLHTKARELIRAGALEGGAALNRASCAMLFDPGSGTDAPFSTSRPGGSPGPGGLVLYLPFDAPPVNNVVQDASGAGNHGRVEGAQWVPEGRFGGAYRFCLTNLTDRIVIPNSDLLNPDYITVSAWIKTTDTDGFWNRILDKDHRKGYNLGLGGDSVYKGIPRGKLIFECCSYGIMDAEGKPLGDGQWHHVAATFDGQISRVFVDGNQRQQRKTEKPGTIAKNHWDLCIGNSIVDSPDGSFLAYDGLIDEVRIYNRALSADEIKMLATATQAGVDILSAPPTDNSVKPDAAERLKKVKSLYDQGLINKEDYDRKVKEIMDSL